MLLFMSEKEKKKKAFYYSVYFFCTFKYKVSCLKKVLKLTMCSSRVDDMSTIHVKTTERRSMLVSIITFFKYSSLSFYSTIK